MYFIECVENFSIFMSAKHEMKYFLYLILKNSKFYFYSYF